MRSHWSALALGGLVMVVASCRGGCCKQPDEDPPPMPSATAPPTASVDLVIEDAGDEADVKADAEDGDAKRSGPSVSTLVACCRTLSQNAKSQKNPLVAGSMIQAAAVCEVSAKNNDVSGVNDALKRFGMQCN